MSVCVNRTRTHKQSNHHDYLQPSLISSLYRHRVSLVGNRYTHRKKLHAILANNKALFTKFVTPRCYLYASQMLLFTETLIVGVSNTRKNLSIGANTRICTGFGNLNNNIRVFGSQCSKGKGCTLEQWLHSIFFSSTELLFEGRGENLLLLRYVFCEQTPQNKIVKNKKKTCFFSQFFFADRQFDNNTLWHLCAGRLFTPADNTIFITCKWLHRHPNNFW